MEWLQQSAIHAGPRVSSNLLFGPLIDAPPSHPDTIHTTLTYMQRSLIDMDMKYIQLSIDIQRFLHYETGMLVSANAVQECGGPPWWYACYTILWLHCRKSSGLEVYEAASYAGLRYYNTIITFTGIFNGKSWVKPMQAFGDVSAALLKRFCQLG